MKRRQLGRTGPTTSMIGLGCMAMSGVYGPSERSEGLATIRAALDAGITLLDTGDFYGMGHNELLIGEVMREVARDSVVLSVKFGVLRDVFGRPNGLDCRPKAIRSFIAYSLTRLGVDHVDIYRPARLDPDVPIEETIGAIADLVKAGYVRHIGLSEVDAGTIERAAAVHPITDLQIDYSLISRGVEGDILDTCRRHGIAVTAYGVLARGLISGHWQRDAERVAGTPAGRTLAVRARTWSGTCGLSTCCRTSPGPGTSAWRRSRSPGSRRAGRTSSRWWGRDAGCGSTRCWAWSSWT